jgi:hypothetical protein
MEVTEDFMELEVVVVEVMVLLLLYHLLEQVDLDQQVYVL